MAIARDHELHRRRFSRNLALGGALVAFVALVFCLTLVKVRMAGPVEGFDHRPRATALPPEPASAPASAPSHPARSVP